MKLMGASMWMRVKDVNHMKKTLAPPWGKKREWSFPFYKYNLWFAIIHFEECPHPCVSLTYWLCETKSYNDYSKNNKKNWILLFGLFLG